MKSRSQKQKIYEMLESYGPTLLDDYLENGPEKLRERLNIQSDDTWKVAFHYLVREKEVVRYCVRIHADYIHALFAANGPQSIRNTFEITESAYDEEWHYVMDYIGISRGALYEYVNNKKELFRDLIYNGKSAKIREILGISSDKYNRTWETILDILLECVATDVYTHSMHEKGISMFTKFYNAGRKHRPIRKPLLADAGASEEKE